MIGFITAPLRVTHGKFEKEESTAKAIDNFLSLLLSTPCGSTPSDPDFGFIFNNLRFEIFNENEGVVYDSTDTAHDSNDLTDIYNKKISGTSKSINTFALDLKGVIECYEKRLDNVNVNMTYVCEDRQIYVTVRGNIAGTDTEYTYHNYIKIWN